MKGQYSVEKSISKFFAYGEYSNNGKVDYYKLELRNFSKDTLINQRQYKKYTTISFTDYYGEKSFSHYYERFDENEYEKLDSNLSRVHRISFDTLMTQLATIFYKEEKVNVLFLDQRRFRSRSNDPFILAKHSLRKVTAQSDSNKYLMINPLIESIKMERSNHLFTKHLTSHLFNQLSKYWDHNFSSPVYSANKIGDELELTFFDRKTEGDTINSHYRYQKAYKLTDYAPSKYDPGHKITLFEYDYINEKDTISHFFEHSYESSYSFEWKKVFRIEPNDTLGNSFKIQGGVIEYLDDKPLHRVIVYDSRYNNFLSKYPTINILFNETPRLESKIVHLKKGSKVLGKTQLQFPRSIYHSVFKTKFLSDNRLLLTFFLLSPSEIKIEMEDNGNERNYKISEEGEHSLTLNMPELLKRENILKLSVSINNLKEGINIKSASLIPIPK